MTNSKPMMPICTQVQMLQMSVPVVTCAPPIAVLLEAKRFSHLSTAVECRAAERMMNANATAKAAATRRVLILALLAEKVGGQRGREEEGERTD